MERRRIELGDNDHLDFIHQEGELEIAVVRNNVVDQKLIFDDDIITEILSELLDIRSNVVSEYNIVREHPQAIYDTLKEDEEARVDFVSREKDVEQFTEDIILPLMLARHTAKNRGLLD